MTTAGSFVRGPADRRAAEPRRARPWMLLNAALIIAAISIGRSVLIPVAVAVLLTFLLKPLAARLERRVRSRVAGVTLVTILAIAVVGVILGAVGQQFVALAADLPGYRETLIRKVRGVRQSGSV